MLAAIVVPLTFLLLAIVGGGGKTTTMFTLAREYPSPVIVAATAHAAGCPVADPAAWGGSAGVVVLAPGVQDAVGGQAAQKGDAQGAGQVASPDRIRRPGVDP